MVLKVLHKKSYFSGHTLKISASNCLGKYDWLIDSITSYHFQDKMRVFAHV